jgi:hypothetical protein
MVFNATFNNIFVASWRYVLWVKETGVPGENHRLVASHLQILVSLNNLIQNIAVIPEIMFNILTFDTNDQHSTWLDEKRDDRSFTITHIPQNNIIPIARVWSLIFTPLPLHSNYIQTFSTPPYSAY